MPRLYLDANGSSPALPEAKEKLISMMEVIGNPSSSHEHGRIVRAYIDEARMHVARAVGAFAKELIFTSGASESNRWFVDALCALALSRQKKLRVLVSPFEHPSMLKPLLAAMERDILNVVICDLDHRGQIISHPNITSFDAVIICQAHNETGIIPDLDIVLAAVHDSTIVMSDIAQGFSRLSQPSSRIDVLSFSAQKMGGFAGVGGLVVRNNAEMLSPQWRGGGQERGLRPGTECSFAIAAMGAAALHVERERERNHNLATLRNYFEQELIHQHDAKIIGASLPRIPNTSAICFNAVDPDALRIGCDMAGLSVGFGSACSGLAPEESFALKRLGLSLVEQKSTVRFSFTSSATRDLIDEALAQLRHVL